MNSAVRAVTWGEGSTLFATASDPFHTRELGAISIFEFPSQEVLSTRKITFLLLHCNKLCHKFLEKP